MSALVVVRWELRMAIKDTNRVARRLRAQALTQVQIAPNNRERALWHAMAEYWRGKIVTIAKGSRLTDSEKPSASPTSL